MIDISPCSPHLIGSLGSSLLPPSFNQIFDYHLSLADELEMKKNTQVTVSSTSTLDAKRDVDLEKLPAAKLAPSSSSLSSTVAGSDNSTPSRFQQFTSKFRSKKSKCQTSAASQPSLASRLKEYLTYDPRDVNRSMLDLNLYQRFRTRLSRLIKALRLVLFLIILWLSLNVPIVLWQYFYIQAKVRPYDYKKLINNKHGWRAFEGLMYFVGFVMMMINFVAGWLLLTMAYERCRGLFGCDQTATRRRFPLIRTITKPIRALILVACCLIGLAFVLMLAAEVFWG